jgi:hypothetical protein
MKLSEIAQNCPGLDDLPTQTCIKQILFGKIFPAWSVLWHFALSLPNPYEIVKYFPKLPFNRPGRPPSSNMHKTKMIRKYISSLVRSMTLFSVSVQSLQNCQKLPTIDISRAWTVCRFTIWYIKRAFCWSVGSYLPNCLKLPFLGRNDLPAQKCIKQKWFGKIFPAWFIQWHFALSLPDPYKIVKNCPKLPFNRPGRPPSSNIHKT